MRHHATTLAAATASALLLASCGVLDEDPQPPVSDDVPPSAEPEEEPATPEETPEPVADSLSQQGVSAGHSLAAETGEQILAEGGNAADAAIASAFVISVVEPFASGIGGGGSVIVAGPNGDPIFYDYREVVNNSGNIPESGSGVPGFVAGMAQLHEDYGSMDWEELLEPARQLAQDGFELTEFLAVRMEQSDGLAAISQLDHYAPGGQPLNQGDQLVQTDLAQTIQNLQQNGPEDYYTGSLADSLVEQVEGIDHESLADYEVVVSEPVSGAFGDYELIGPAPALPGAAMIQMLQIAEAAGIADLDPGSAEYVNTLSRAWLAAEETVFGDLGDPSFVQVPVDELTDPETNAQIDVSAQGISPQGAASQDTAPQGSVPQDTPADDDAEAVGAGTGGSTDAPNTTHISTVDSEGLSVSMTNTIMYFWGSGQAVDGYFMNNHLSRFDAIPSGANQPAPGRRTVTWSNPAMVLDSEGRPVLVIGSPGGHQILNILGTVMVQWGLQGRTLEESLATPRFRAAEDLLYLESSTSDGLISDLESAGWSTEVWPDIQASFGSIQALEIDWDTGEVHSADDPRREGAHRILD